MSELNLDAYRLRQFVAVAEQLNITRAAAELHLTQQAVSSTIKALERDLKVTLLIRSGRTIALTPAGTRLLEGAKPLLDAGSSLVRATRAAATEQGEHLTIGYTPGVSLDELFDLVTPLRQTHPDVSITAHHMLADEITTALQRGRIDIALRRAAFTPADMTTAVVAHTPLAIAVAATHRYAARNAVALHELAGQRLIVSEPPGRSSYTDFLLGLCLRSGFEPPVTRGRIHGTSPTTMVIGTEDFTFVTTELGPHHHAQVTVLPLEDKLMAPLQAIWLRHTTSRLRDKLLVKSIHHDTIPHPHPWAAMTRRAHSQAIRG